MDHKDLDVWKKGMDLVLAVYQATGEFPKEELYGLTSQVRRAAVSIPSNIAEGAARNSDKEFTQFLHITLGSLAELETQWILAERLGFFGNNRSRFTVHNSSTRSRFTDHGSHRPVPSSLLNDIQTVRKMVVGLIKHLRSKHVGK